MRMSAAAVAALVSIPVLLGAGSAVALDVYFDQVTGVAGGALGIVGGPVGGLVGHVLGQQIGLKIHPRPRQIDLTDLKSRAHVTPIGQGRVLDSGAGMEDRAVDSTPVRMIELRPAETETQTYLASTPSPAQQGRTYQVSARRRASSAETYLVAAPNPAAEATAPAGDNPAAPPGTLDYQLNQLSAGHGADGAAVQKVADVR